MIFFFSFFAIVYSQSIDDIKVVLESDALSGLEMRSPWGVAFFSDTLYFSNFGAPSGIKDFIGESDRDGEGAKLLLDAENRVMHVRHLAVDDSGLLYATVYRGMDEWAILKCDGDDCNEIISEAFDEDHPLQPTALVWSETLNKLFYALADGNLEESAIFTCDSDGGNNDEFLRQSSDNGLENPVGLTVDDENSFVYWSNGAGPNLLQRASFDADGAASDVGTVWHIDGDDDERPHHLAIDVAARRIYFTDQGATGTHAIARFNLRSLRVELLEELDSALPHGIALDIDSKTIFWSETASSTISSGTVEDMGETNDEPVAGAAATSLLSSVAALIVFAMTAL